MDFLQFAEAAAALANTELVPGSGVSVMDAIRAAAGGDLVWSAHLYPHWMSGIPNSADEFREQLDRMYGILGDDDIIM